MRRGDGVPLRPGGRRTRHAAGGRTLILNSARHSYVDLNDPEHLEFAYTQWIGAVADTVRPPGAPIDALHLGGGGFTVPKYVRATRPGSDQLVVELDGGLVDLDRRRARAAHRCRSCGPGRRRPGRARRAARPAAYDLVVGDAFGHLVVPVAPGHPGDGRGHRAGCCRPDGVYAQNVIDYPPDRFIRAELATVADVFPHVALIAPPDALAGETGANFVIVAVQVAAAARPILRDAPGPGRPSRSPCSPAPSWTPSSATPGC